MLLVIGPPRCAGLLLKRLLLFIHSWNLYWELLDKVRLPCWLRGKESICQSRRCKFNPWVGKIALRRKWQPTPAFLPGKSRGQRSLAGYSPRSCKRLWHEWLRTRQYPCMVSLILKQASHRQSCTVESGWIQIRGQKFYSHYDPEQASPSLCSGSST